MNDKVRYPHRKNENRILEDVCHQKFIEIYEEQLCVKFQNRLKKELKCIASLNISGVFLIFKELFERLGWKEYEHGFRGTIGSSLVAYLCGLTATDPLREDIQLYSEFCFGYDFNKEPDFNFLVPTGRTEGMCKVLSQIEGVASVVPAQLENGQGHINAKYLIPEGEEIPRYCKYDVAPYFKLTISESKQIDLLVRLVELTGVTPCKVDMGDANILKMYKHTDAPDLIRCGENRITALGLPEVRTFWMANLLHDTGEQIKSFADIVRVDGLSHSTTEWCVNKENIATEFTLELNNILTSREDVYEYCIKFGVSSYNSFRVAENVRKGRGGLMNLYSADVEGLAKIKQQIPKWFMEMCWDVRYLFPRAHCYHMMLLSWRCAYYKYYHPIAFYRAYFEVMADSDISCAVFEGQEAYDRLKRAFTKDVLQYQEECVIDFAVADEMFYAFAGLTRKKVFTCGVSEKLQRKISYNIGVCEITDITDHLTDVFALQTDVVVINTDVMGDDDINLIREYELEVDDPSVKYYYLSEKEIENVSF